MAAVAKSSRLSPGERKSLIERAAVELFAERGYAATTVGDIVEAAGVTKPMLYRHFESKQDLCVTLMRRFRAELIAAPLERFTPGAGDPAAQLRPMLDAWLEHIERNRAAARMLFAPMLGDEEVERVQRELHAQQRDSQMAIIRELVDGVSEAELEALGEAMRSALSAVALWWLERPEVPRSVPLDALLKITQGIPSDLAAPNPSAWR